MRLWKEIKQKMLEHPEQTISENNMSDTYENLVYMVEEKASEMRGKYRCCAIICDSELATAKAVLSCFAADITAVPLSKKYGKNHYDKIVELIGPDAIITDKEDNIIIEKQDNPSYCPPQIHPAVIMCTSGTTGIPKGVMLTEDNLLTNVTDISAYFNVDYNDTILIARPIYHSAVLTGEFLLSLWKGLKIEFYSDTFNPPAIYLLLQKKHITTFCGTPSLIKMMIKFVRNYDEFPIKHLCISGECMSYNDGKEIRALLPNSEIYHVYGLTEASPRVSYLPPDLFGKYHDCVGIPLNSVEIKIIKENSIPAELDEYGVLYIKGNNVMSGYYKNRELTDKVIKDGWLNTNDIATITSDGFLKIKGRADDMIIKGGMNIYPQEIENTLKADKRTREVLAYGYTDSNQTKIGIKISGDFNNIKEVHYMCMNLLPSFQVPSRITIVESIPKTITGKIKRG